MANDRPRLIAKGARVSCPEAADMIAAAREAASFVIVPNSPGRSAASTRDRSAEKIQAESATEPQNNVDSATRAAGQAMTVAAPGAFCPQPTTDLKKQWICPV
jgi:hypothetical protein